MDLSVGISPISGVRLNTPRAVVNLIEISGCAAIPPVAGWRPRRDAPVSGQVLGKGQRRAFLVHDPDKHVAEDGGVLEIRLGFVQDRQRRVKCIT